MVCVSIIIPVYNAEKFLENCIESVLKQTVDFYEVIIIDDGSIDNSYNIAMKYAQGNENKIRVYKQQNSGQGAARNKGVQLALGKYVLFVDSDDLVSPFLVEHTYQAIEKVHADMLIFDAEIADEHGKRIEGMKGCRSKKNVLSLQEFPELLLEFPAPWNKIYRKSLFVDYGLYYPTHMWYEDLVGASIFYTGAQKIAVLHEELYQYIQWPSSVMHSKISQKNRDILKAMDLILTFYQKHSLYEKFYTELEFMGIYHILIAAAGRTVRGNYKSIMHDEFLDYMNEYFPNWKSNSYMDRLSAIQKLKLKLLSKRQYAILSLLYKIGKKNAV